MQKVEICGVDTAGLPKLSAKENEELMVRIKAGDKQARATFIEVKHRRYSRILLPPFPARALKAHLHISYIVVILRFSVNEVTKVPLTVHFAAEDRGRTVKSRFPH